MKKLTAWCFTIFMGILFVCPSFSQDSPVGSWKLDKNNLPLFHYTGDIPFKAKNKDNKDANLNPDPYFLLGNYRLTLFTHASGKYQLITGERSWGRLNQADINRGSNGAVIEVNGKKTYSLIGENETAQKATKHFGIGYANYAYEGLSSIDVKRSIRVAPSTNLRNGASAFIINVQISNKGDKKADINYREYIDAKYQMMQQQRTPDEYNLVQYTNDVETSADGNQVKVHFNSSTQDPLLFPTPETVSSFEGYPPVLFFQKADGLKGLALYANKKENNTDRVGAEYKAALKAGETISFDLMVGFYFEESGKTAEEATNELKAFINKDHHAIAQAWKKRLPTFENEKDLLLRREMTWNAYCLEAMATYKSYYDETFIPQGTAYDYDWGLSASTRDHNQHGLAACYYNPELAKSILRMVMKRTTHKGEILLTDLGYGYNSHLNYFTSDQQLYFINLLNEYLRITEDYDFLLEEVGYLPREAKSAGTVLEHAIKCFSFLKDEVRVGSHGLVRLLNSDWNDMFFYMLKVPYNHAYYTAESHMNTAMALVFIPELKKHLEHVSALPEFKAMTVDIKLAAESMEFYRQNLYQAYMQDWGERAFPRRIYINHEMVFGEDQMYLEPQGFTLQLEDLSLEKKKALFAEIENRLIKGEALGARQQEKPMSNESLVGGSRENGGFWYALNGPLIIGVNTFDQEKSWELLKKITFENFSSSFPNYWSGYWSAPDNIESSLIPTEGLPDQKWLWGDSPVYCAHSHAWPLYCYYRLKE